MDCVDSERKEDATFELPRDFFSEPRRSRIRHVDKLVARTPGHPKGMEILRTWYQSGDVALIPTLTAVVNLDPDEDVRRSALGGLGRMPDRAAIPGLLPGLRSTDRRSRFLAVSALGRLGARESLPDLVELLGDRYCRTAAAEALVAIRDERALEPLRHAAAQARPWRRRRLRRRVDELEAAVGYQRGTGTD